VKYNCPSFPQKISDFFSSKYQCVRQGWFNSDGDLILGDDDKGVFPPPPEEPPELLAPGLPAPPALALSQGGDTNFYFLNASKQMMAELQIEDLQLIFKALVLPMISTQPSAKDVAKWSASADHLRKLIQAEVCTFLFPSSFHDINSLFITSITVMGS
jgi:hypothetical protein